MADEAFLAAVTAIIKGLARESASSPESSPSTIPTSNGPKIIGIDGGTKAAFELELGRLEQRIHMLQHTAMWAVNPAMPDITGDATVTKPLFRADNALQQPCRHVPPIPHIGTTSSIEPTLDDGLLEGCSIEAQSFQAYTSTQLKTVVTRSGKIANPNSALPGQEEQQPLAGELGDVGRLFIIERELGKH